MNVAAVVVRWRGGDEVDRCLQSLLEHGGPRLARVILVDSGSGDGGAERLAEAFPEVEVTALEENLSFAHAANTGAGACHEDLLLLLNPDTEVLAGTLTALTAELDHRPDSAGVVPLLVDPDGSSQHRWQLRRLPTTARLAMGLPGAPASAPEPKGPSPVEQPAAAAWLLRRSVWDALGGLDSTFAPAWWEDVDFCARLARQMSDPAFPANEGFTVVPTAQIRHDGGSSVRELGNTAFLTAYHRNLLRYAARHHPDRLTLIGKTLRWSLLGRSVLRPQRRRAYGQAIGAIVDTLGP